MSYRPTLPVTPKYPHKNTTFFNLQVFLKENAKNGRTTFYA
jgi:hypothetical protein